MEDALKVQQVVLSRRLQALADMVTPGHEVADVGCDHGFLSIYLVQRGISPKVLAMDVRSGPLSRAQEHIAEYGLGDYIETRLSDGLMAYGIGEAATMVCAGMGGRLMSGILSQCADKARSFKELILQPQSELLEFRKFLRKEGYTVLDEDILCEEGKYYFIIKAVYTGELEKEEAEKPREESGIRQELGTLLFQRRHPVLKEYLAYRVVLAGQIAAALEGRDKERTRERYNQVQQELQELEQALAELDLQ